MTIALVVASGVGGFIASLSTHESLDPGDRVARGQVLAVLHPMVPALLDARTEAELRERVGAAEASLARALTAVERSRATLAKSKADLERTRALASRNFVSAAQVERDELTVSVNTRELEAVQFEQHAARLQLDLARAALARSRTGWQMGHGESLEIRSPVAGVVFRLLGSDRDHGTECHARQDKRRNPSDACTKRCHIALRALKYGSSLEASTARRIDRRQRRHRALVAASRSPSVPHQSSPTRSAIC
ncbi:MAG: hypothetical protein ACXW2L_20120 [Burkholderiales bacterium]